MVIAPEVLFTCLQKDLSEAGCTDSATMFPGISVRDAFAVSIRESLVKKFISNIKADADSKALEKFLKVNEACRTWTLRLNNSKTETLVGLVRQVLYEFWYKPCVGPELNARDKPLWDHPYDLLQRGHVGSGSNIGARGGSAYAKLYSSPLTCSDPSLYFWYSRYIKNFPEWSNAENIRCEHFGSVSVTKSSRLSFVPKNDEISRVICVEPTLNTFYQLGIGRILEGRIQEKFGISLKTQPFLNRDLARLGSITGGLSTIDLSSASDSISLEMLKCLLPSDFYSQLVRYRCATIDVKGRGTVPLHMVSTMGNGFTFPLQTMLFASCVIACARFRELSLDGLASDRLWGVFGDDIIVPSLITRDVIALLDVLGFTVNDDKTFVEGPFRESCGADFLNGVNIRGVYLKQMNTEQDLYQAVNQLIRYETRSGIQLGHTITVLLSKIKDVLMVPPYEDMSCGIHVPYSLVRNIYPRSRELQSISYRLWVPRPPRLRIEDGYIKNPAGVKTLIYNPSGLLMSFLLGEVNGWSIGVRVDTVRYSRKRRFSSFWDEKRVIVRDHRDYALDWQQWNTVVGSYFERS